MNRILGAMAIASLAVSSAMSEDVVAAGKTYRNVRVEAVEPDGIKVGHSGGICKLNFTDLPAEWQRRYGYNPDQAAAYQDQLRQRAELRQAGPTSKASPRITAERKRLTVDLEVLEPRRDGIVATGTYQSFRTGDRRQTNEDGRVSALRVTSMTHVPLGTIFVIGLTSGLEKGSRWASVIYPVGSKRDGHPVYAPSLDQVEALVFTGNLPPEPKTHPFLRGLGDGLTWPLRLAGYSGLRFAPPEDREFRYWCGSTIGWCCYLLVLIPLLGKKKEKKR